MKDRNGKDLVVGREILFDNSSKGTIIEFNDQAVRILTQHHTVVIKDCDQVWYKEEDTYSTWLDFDPYFRDDPDLN